MRRVEWGTKDTEIKDLNVTILVLDINGRRTPNVSQYSGRRFGSWNRQSNGQVKFTLKPISAVDNQVFIFRFVPNKLADVEVFDIVQLIVKGKSFFIM